MDILQDVLAETFLDFSISPSGVWMEADWRSGPIEIQERGVVNSAAPTNRVATLFPYCGSGLNIVQDFYFLKNRQLSFTVVPLYSPRKKTGFRVGARWNQKEDLARSRYRNVGW